MTEADRGTRGRCEKLAGSSPVLRVLLGLLGLHLPLGLHVGLVACQRNHHLRKEGEQGGGGGGGYREKKERV